MNTRLKYGLPTEHEPQTNDSRVTARFLVSTQQEDREQDILVTAGLDLADHIKSPVVLLNHAATDLPIGISESPDGFYTGELFPERGQFWSTCHFHQKTELGCQAYELTKAKILRGASPGFIVTQAEARGKREKSGRPPLLIQKSSLLEWSVVTVPANANAVRSYGDMVREQLSREKVAGSKLHPHLRKNLELLADPKKVWSHGATLEDKPMTGQTVQSLIVKADAFASWSEAKSWLAEQGYEVGESPTMSDDNGSRFEFFPVTDIVPKSAFPVALSDRAVATFAVNKNAPAIDSPPITTNDNPGLTIIHDAPSAARLKAVESEVSDLKKELAELKAVKAAPVLPEQDMGDVDALTAVPDTRIDEAIELEKQNALRLLRLQTRLRLGRTG